MSDLTVTGEGKKATGKRRTVRNPAAPRKPTAPRKPASRRKPDSPVAPAALPAVPDDVQSPGVPGANAGAAEQTAVVPTSAPVEPLAPVVPVEGADERSESPDIAGAAEEGAGSQGVPPAETCVVPAPGNEKINDGAGQLQEAGTFPATVETFSLTAVCAHVTVKPGEGDSFRVLAQNPKHWSVGPGGRVRQSGGAVAEALALDRTGRSYGSFNGEFRINGVKVDVPPAEQREKLVVEVPAGFTGDLDINGEMFAVMQVEVKGRRAVEVHSKDSADVTLTEPQDCTELCLYSQSLITARDCTVSGGVTLRTELKGRISGGKIKARDGAVMLSANNDSALIIGKVIGKQVSATASIKSTIEAESATSYSKLVTEASVGGVVRFKYSMGLDSIEANASNAAVHLGTVLTRTAVYKASVNGRITCQDCDAQSLFAEASVSSCIEISAGSADGGKASASVGAKVILNGYFAEVSCSQSVGGRVLFTDGPPNADMFVRAGKRYFDRKFCEDQHGVTASLLMTMVLGNSGGSPDEVAATLSQPAVVRAFMKGIKAAYADVAVSAAIETLAAALRANLSEDDFKNQEKVNQVLTSAEVVGKFQEAFGLFSARVSATFE